MWFKIVKKKCKANFPNIYFFRMFHVSLGISHDFYDFPDQICIFQVNSEQQFWYLLKSECGE